MQMYEWEAPQFLWTLSTWPLNIKKVGIQENLFLSTFLPNLPKCLIFHVNWSNTCKYWRNCIPWRPFTQFTQLKIVLSLGYITQALPGDFLSSGNSPLWHQHLLFNNEPLLRKQLWGSSHLHCGYWDPDKWPLRSQPTVFAQT